MLGFLLLFVALAAIFSRLVRPVVAVIGAPFARFGRTSGELATFNVKRNPGRTASTAAALMIGITLVSFVALFGRSLRGADEAAWKSQVTADYVVTSQNGWDTFPTFAADAGRTAEGVQRAFTRARRSRPRRLRERGHQRHRPGDDRRRSSRSTSTERRSPRCAGTRRSSRTASPRRTTSGSATRSRSAARTARRRRLKAVGIFTSPKLDSLLNAIVIPNDTFDAALPRPRDQYAFVNVAGGASDEATTALKQIYGRDQIAKVETRDGFAADKSKWLSQFLNMIYVLLALSVIVSLFGIVNTLALAVFERTREIGMLRAVGMTRRQARRMIRHEAMMTSLLGAALGLPVGIGLAALAVQGLSSYGLTLVGAGPVARDLRRALARRRGARGGAARAPGREAERPGRAAVRVAAGHVDLVRGGRTRFARLRCSAWTSSPTSEPMRRIAAEVAAEWELELGEPFALSRYSYVAPAGDDAVLKVAWHGDDESLHEGESLELWDGNGAVRLLRADPARRALLEERAVPGDDISGLPEERRPRSPSTSRRRSGDRRASRFAGSATTSRAGSTTASGTRTKAAS